MAVDGWCLDRIQLTQAKIILLSSTFLSSDHSTRELSFYLMPLRKESVKFLITLQELIGSGSGSGSGSASRGIAIEGMSSNLLVESWHCLKAFVQYQTD